MKKDVTIYLFVIAFCTFISVSCRKDKLPELTQTGRGTIGCLIDGKVLKPSGNILGGPIKKCVYVQKDGGYYFGLFAKDNRGNPLKSISITTDSLPLVEGQTIALQNPDAKGGASAELFLSPYTDNSISYTKYTTTSSVEGELSISKLDSIGRIISGTFWFDAVDANGSKAQVREGRFDMQY